MLTCFIGCRAMFNSACRMPFCSRGGATFKNAAFSTILCPGCPVCVLMHPERTCFPFCLKSFTIAGLVRKETHARCAFLPLSTCLAPRACLILQVMHCAACDP